eukprot:COSAG01_NODE_7392_length_3226_cov_11.354013_3_plen_112_part_00
MFSRQPGQTPITYDAWWEGQYSLAGSNGISVKLFRKYPGAVVAYQLTANGSRAAGWDGPRTYEVMHNTIRSGSISGMYNANKGVIEFEHGETWVRTHGAVLALCGSTLSAC